MTRHSNHSIKIHSTDEDNAVVIGLLSSLSHNLGSEITAPDTGDPYDLAQLVTMQKPTIGWGTHCLKSVLDLVSLTGKAIDADETHPGVVMYAAKHDNSGTAGRAGSGNHLSVTFALGHFQQESISASVGQDAIITGRMHGITDDASTAPYVVAYNASLPSSPVINERYTLGKPTVLGTAVSRVRSQVIDYNPQITISEDADSIWPTLVDIEKIRTLVTIVTEDPTWLNASGRIDPLGEVCGHNNTAIYWIRREASGAPVSGGTFKDFSESEHISMTLAGLVHVSEHYSASGSGVSATQIQIAGIEASGVAPVVTDTTAAYPN